MKTSRSALFLALLLLPVTMFAATTNHKNVRFDRLTTVAGTQLKPGTYKLEWNGQGSGVEVNFIRNNKIVARTPAQVLYEPSGYNEAISTHKTSTGWNRLDEVDLKDVVLNFRQGN